MTAQYARADALREYLSGAASDGGTQIDPGLSLGGFRASSETGGLAVLLGGTVQNVRVLFASGANPSGPGILVAPTASSLAWQPAGYSDPGPEVAFSGADDVEVLEALGAAGAYLRVSGTPPWDPTAVPVTLAAVVNNVFGMDDVSSATAAAGSSEYRATVVKNVSARVVRSFQRWLGLLGTARISDAGQLGAAGSGTITTTSSLADWPASGWCRIQSSGGALREVVYYTSRTATALTVPAAGRARFGTAATAGAAADTIQPVPGLAIGIDPAGVQAEGSSFQTVANGTTAPAGVTWNLAVAAAGGLQVGTLNPGRQVGLWFWRELPAGTRATPLASAAVVDAFSCQA